MNPATCPWQAAKAALAAISAGCWPLRAVAHAGGSACRPAAQQARTSGWPACRTRQAPGRPESGACACPAWAQAMLDSGHKILLGLWQAIARVAIQHSTSPCHLRARASSWLRKRVPGRCCCLHLGHRPYLLRLGEHGVHVRLERCTGAGNGQLLRQRWHRHRACVLQALVR